MCEEDYIWKPVLNGEYLESTIDYSIFTCDDIMETTKTVPTEAIPTNFNKKKATCKTDNFYIWLTFLLITISLLIIVYIYCYHIKHESKQKLL